jgi:hypothetical protein
MPVLYLSGPYAVVMLVKDQISTDAGQCLGPEMRGQNLQWCTNMMGTEWDMLRGCSGLFNFTIKMLLVVWKFLIA